VTQPSLLLEIGAGPDADPEDIERLRIQLRRDLEEIGAVSVESIEVEATPEDAKSVDVLAVGTMLVKFAPAALGALARVLQAWVATDNRRTITVQMGEGEVLTLTGATDDERQRLVDAWLTRQRQRLGDV
jgi:hypothetical protein